jgi:hypothetical protein
MKHLLLAVCVIGCSSVHGAMLDDANIHKLMLEQNISYSSSFQSAVHRANSQHATQIDRAEERLLSEDNIIIIQIFRDFGKELYTWEILPEDALIDDRGDLDESSVVSLSVVQWSSFSKWICPPFPKLIFNGDQRSQGIEPFTFIRVLIKEGDFSCINFYVNPLFCVEAHSGVFDSNNMTLKSAQNSFGLICSLENLRQTKGIDLFSYFSSVRNLGEAFLDDEEVMIMRTVESRFDKKSDALNLLIAP